MSKEVVHMSKQGKRMHPTDEECTIECELSKALQCLDNRSLTSSIKSLKLFTEHFSICVIKKIVIAYSSPCIVDADLQYSVS